MLEPYGIWAPGDLKSLMGQDWGTFCGVLHCVARFQKQKALVLSDLSRFYSTTISKWSWSLALDNMLESG